MVKWDSHRLLYQRLHFLIFTLGAAAAAAGEPAGEQQAGTHHQRLPKFCTPINLGENEQTPPWPWPFLGSTCRTNKGGRDADTRRKKKTKKHQQHSASFIPSICCEEERAARQVWKWGGGVFVGLARMENTRPRSFGISCYTLGRLAICVLRPLADGSRAGSPRQTRTSM